MKVELQPINNMVQKQLQNLIFGTLLISSLFGCTLASTEISSIGESVLFSSKSAGPFEQNLPGGYFTLSGSCLNIVTGFQFRLNQLAVWTNIPSTPPTPGAYEYLVGTPEYDVDCSDGDYNFYIFKSQAMDNFTANAAAFSDPYRVEMAAVSSIALPTLIFEQTAPSRVSVTPYQYYNGGAEPNGSFQFEVNLLDADNNEARPLNTDIVLVLSLENISTPSGSVGELRAQDCVTTLTSTDLTFFAGSGDDSKIFCYVATSTTPGESIRITASATDITSSYFDFDIKNSFSGIAWWVFGSGSDYDAPNVLVRGAEYRFNMGLGPLVNAGARSVNNYNGQLIVNAGGDPEISFRGEPADTNCPVAASTGSMTCSFSSGGHNMKPVIMQVGSNYSGSHLSVSTNAVPMASCGSNCTIYQLPTIYNMTDYVGSVRSLPVVPGPATYDHARLLFEYSDTAQIGQCERIRVHLANSNGQIIPTPATSQTITVSVQGGDPILYAVSGCASSSSSSQSVTFNQYDLFQSIYINVPSMPSNGIVELIFTDGVSTWGHTVYTEAP